MVLGIRSKSRKSVSIQVNYIIHVQEIKPWPPSQSLRSVQSVLLQWENGDHNSGSLASGAGEGKIQFNESFRLSVLMWREASKKGKQRENFQKNCLEFYLYDKTGKRQLLGSTTINLADFGIIRETKAISTQLNCKRSFRNSAQPYLYVNIQPFDIECSSSSPNSSLSKELSLDNEESGSVSQSVNDGDDLEIASFTDDDSDDIPPNTLQTIRSSSETTGDNSQIGKGGTKGSNGEFLPPSENTTSSLLGITEGEASTQFNGIKSPSSSVVLSPDMRNAADGRPSLPKISEESVKVAGASSRIPESIQQFSDQNIAKGDTVKDTSSASYSSLSMQPNFQIYSLSQVTQDDSMNQEDTTQDQRYNKDGPEKVKSVSNTGVLEDKEKMDKRRKGKEQFIMRNELLENELVNNFSGDVSTRKGKLNTATPLLSKKSHEHPTSIMMTDKADNVRTVKFPHQSADSSGKFSRSQTLDQAEEINTLTDVQVDTSSHEDWSKDTTQDQRYNKDGPEKISSISNTGVLEDKRRKGKEQFTMRNELLENVLVNNFSDDDSTRKGKLNSATPLLSKKSHEHPTSILMYDKVEDVRTVKFPRQSADSYGQFSRSQTLDQAEEIITLNDVQVDTSSHEDWSKDTTQDQRYNKDDPEKISSVSNTGVLEDKRRKGKEQFTMRNELLENVLVNNFSDDDSTRKGKLNSATPLLSKKSHEHPTSILMNDRVEDVRTVKFPHLSADSYGQFGRSQTLDQADEINTLNDVQVGTASHEDINVNGSFPNDITELKAEVEMLREELSEAAALEVSLYSVIAEHSSSSNKVHAPARRLSRFYFHTCRVGSPAMIASAAQSAVSGFVLVSKACGNDVPRLTFWFSNLILLRAIVNKGVEEIHLGGGQRINSECDGNDPALHEEKKENTKKQFHRWEDPETFLVALEKVEAWIFSRIVESVWWQTLTPYMQSAAAKNSSSRKIYGRGCGIGDQDQGSFSIDLWERAFKDACERLCPLRAGGLECGCLPVIARLVMEQLVNRLDVAMFNAILRESDEEIPTDPISDPISDPKVLPIPAGKSGLGAGAQLKNAIGNWTRWLSDLFGTDDSDSREDSNENEPKCESAFKPFQFLNALSDLMMLPLEMLADGSMRKEVCPRFGVSLIKQVVNNFVPDEFSPGPVPDAVLEALNDEDNHDDEGSITSFPCTAGSTFYAAPLASSVVSMLQEVGTQNSLRSGSFVLKKLYTSDDELDELDSPLSALGMDDSSPISKKKLTVVKGGRKVLRYELLREVWRSTE